MDQGSARRLLEAAVSVRERSYSPYSNFAVGAALLDEAGVVHLGTNVENAAYPSGICAEGGAISAMIASGGRRIAAIAIAGPEGSFCAPCGNCRQRIREFATPETEIIIGTRAGPLATRTLDALLPESFGPESLSPG